MKSKQTVRPQSVIFPPGYSLNVFFHELLVKVRSQSIVDETSLFLVDFAASTVLKNNVVVPSEHNTHTPTKHSVNKQTTAASITIHNGVSLSRTNVVKYLFTTTTTPV